LVTSTSGRPIKIEGNPLHPAAKGKSDLHAQASLLNLYDPDRSHRFVRQGSEATRAEFIKALDALREGWQSAAGKGLAFLSWETHSPTLNRLRRELTAKYPGHVWAVHEPLLFDAEAKAARLAYGQDVLPVPRFEKAEVILSLDHDFLGSDGTLAAMRGFADGRKVEDGASKMNRLYVVESRYSATGAMADHRLRLPSSRIAELATALLGAVTGQAANMDGVDPKWIAEAAADLVSAAGKALVMAGPGQPVEVHLMVASLNQALGAMGTTLEFVKGESLPALDLSELSAQIRSGAVTDLVILGANPVYNAAVDLDWAKLQKSLKNVVHLGTYEDETAALSTWHAPLAEYLETWGDSLLQDGSYGCIQPLILPLREAISEIQLVACLLGQVDADGEFVSGPELVQETFKQRLGAGFNKNAWNKFVHDGFWSGSDVKTPVTFNGNAMVAGRAALSAKIPDPNNLELVFVADSKLDDGRYANNGWLQELPDFMTKLTWDNAVLVGPATAAALGLKQEVKNGHYFTDIIRIELDGRSVEAPILIVPGQADNSLVLPLGYGRAATGKVGQGVGFNFYGLRTVAAPSVAVGARVTRTGRTHMFAITQEHWSMEGRDIVREAPIAYYRKNPEFVRKLGLEDETPPDKSFYQSPPFDYSKHYQWGMVIDLTSCVGCNACVVACQSENNIPIVGKEQVAKGREMHWIRVDRYFSGSQSQWPNGHAEIPNDPEVVMQPVACMQCENAPCETVCPVNATVHNEEGLNVMAYNRCIGTRYCANNCPYKVRRFNFFDYNQRQLDQLYFGPLGPKGTAETIQMSKNPNVSVRMRGVMEKCTFCVQRLESAKIDHKVQTRRDGTKLPGDAIQTACQQACPADAIVFGDLSDPDSRVTKLKKRELNYKLLDYLNTQPRLSYLAKIRNPNPKMPGADKVGMGLINIRLGAEAAGAEEKKD